MSFIKNIKFFTAVFFISLLVFAPKISVFSTRTNKAKICNNVYVYDLCLKDLSRSEAIELLKKNFDNYFDDKKMNILLNDKTFTLLLNNFNTKVNYEETVDYIFANENENGIFSEMRDILGFPGKKIKVKPIIKLNRDKIFDSMKDFLTGENLPRDYSFELTENALTVRKGKDGYGFDRDKFSINLLSKISERDFTDISTVFEPLKAKPFIVEEFYAELTASAVDAKYDKKNNEVFIIPEKRQVVDLTIEELKLFLEKNDEEVFTMSVNTKAPEKTKKILEERLFRDSLSSYTTRFATNKNRVHNIRKASSKCNGVVLLPNETISIDKIIGPRTKANGFLPSKIYVGNSIEIGIGGGICQCSSTIYGGALYAGLNIIERTSHSLPVSYVPLGGDATLAQGVIDLKIKNNTEYPVKILITVNANSMVVNFIGTKYGLDFDEVEVKHTKISDIPFEVEKRTDPNLPLGKVKIVRKGQNGCCVSSIRFFKKNGVIVKEENLPSSHYRSIDAIEVVGLLDVAGPPPVNKKPDNNQTEVNNNDENLEIDRGEAVVVVPENNSNSEPDTNVKPNVDDQNQAENVLEQVLDEVLEN